MSNNHKNKRYFPDACFLCGSKQLGSVRYLALNSPSLVRNLAYVTPTGVARFLSKLSHRFASAFHPVMTNKKYFSGAAVYCLECRTGSHQPGFKKQVLDNYYREFYWTNRDARDGQHIALGGCPNDNMLALSRSRINWIKQHVDVIDSVIDFGAGDCAASYIFANDEGIEKVFVVDPSLQAGMLAKCYGLRCFDDLSAAPTAGLLYSAHSIEHVHDLLVVICEMLKKVQWGGFLFFETPNIGDYDVFVKLVHTPHTFMLSKHSFQFMEQLFPVKLVAMEICGPLWRAGYSNIRSGEHTDLRVLLQKQTNI